MATGDKVVTLDGLKAVFDYQQDEVSDLKSNVNKTINIDMSDPSLWVTKTGGTISQYPTRLVGNLTNIHKGDVIHISPSNVPDGGFNFALACYDKGNTRLYDGPWLWYYNDTNTIYTISVEGTDHIEIWLKNKNDASMADQNNWTPYIDAISVDCFIQAHEVADRVDKLRKEVEESGTTFGYDDVTGNYNADYYRNFISSLEGITGDTLFAIQTDMHYARLNGFPASMKNVVDLVQLSKLTKIPLVTNLGDIVNGWVRRPNQMIDITRVVQSYLESKSRYIQVVGNHDDNSWYANAFGYGYEEIVDPGLWGRLVSIPISARTDVVTLPNKRYGVWEDFTNHVRYIYLDTLDLDYTLTASNGKPKYWGQWKYAIRQEQIDFLIDSLLLVGSNFRVIILSHNSLADGPDYANTTVINADIVRGILEAFKNKTTYTGSNSTTDFEVSVSVDFSNTNHSGLIGCFAGHNHADAMYTINGITYVQTDNSSVLETGDDGRSSSDTTSDVIDVVRVNFTTKLVTLKRFGYGSDRSFTYS